MSIIERLRKLGFVGYRRRALIREHFYVTHLRGHTGIHGIVWRVIKTDAGHYRYTPASLLGRSAATLQWVIPIFPRVRRPLKDQS